MSKWAVWFDQEAGEKHVVPMTVGSDFPEEPHIVDKDCECNPEWDGVCWVHKGQDDAAVVQ